MVKNLNPDSKIYVAGHRGLVGSAIVRKLRSRGFNNLIYRTHQELDLADQLKTQAFFETERPEYAFIAAAKVGGIGRNDRFRADMIRENLQIQTNVIGAAFDSGVEKLLFLGSSCIYPKMAPQPMPESALLAGPLEYTNEAYAVAKIAGLMLCKSIAIQYKRRFISLMPTNVYGPNDNYDPITSHVLPGLIGKIHAAKVAGTPQFKAWGTGKPLREFIYSDDLADAALFCMEKYEGVEHLNVGTGQEIMIRDLVSQIKEAVGYPGEVTWQTDQPDGTPRKLLDSGKLFALGWQPQVSLREGISLAYQDFLSKQKSV